MDRLIWINIFFIIFFNGLADWYIYKYFIRKIAENRAVKIIHWAVDAVFVFLLMYMFAGVYSNGIHISPEAYQDFMFIYLLVYVPKAVYMVFTLPAFLSRKRNFKRGVYIFGTFVSALLLVSCLYGATIGKSKLKVNQVEVYSDKLPVEFDGYNIIHFSDIHLGNLRNDKIIRKILDEIEVLRPDIIIFSGDLVHSRTSEVYKFQEILAEFHAPDGVYTILGNHDYGDYYRWATADDYRKNREDLEDFYKNINWILLNNESEFIHRGAESISIIGVENWGEPPFPQYGDLKKATENVPEEDFKILITHNPNHWIAEVLGKTDIDLALSGHTHGMQLAFNFFGKRVSPASLRYKFWGGLYNIDGQYIYVNEGIGFVLFPFRLGSPPELTLITLRNNEAI
ncbi:MAG: metallophosphoesterase [Rikenellaceae bacterium]|nr:metallophosphoesterase [Rikenellaceae bacterium]